MKGKFEVIVIKIVKEVKENLYKELIKNLKESKAMTE